MGLKKQVVKATALKIKVFSKESKMLHVIHARVLSCDRILQRDKGINHS